MRLPTVTAIIPTTGRPSIRRAVASCLRQSAPVKVLVVLDDPDAITQVKRKLEGLSCSIVQTSGHRGRGACRNLGVQFADTEYVAFLEDDDEWVAQKTELQLSEATERTAVSSRAMLVGTSSRIVPQRLYESKRGSLAEYVLDRSALQLRHHFMQTSSMLCSRQAALEVPWNESLPQHQDWDWLIRLEAAGITVRQRAEVLVKVAQDSRRRSRGTDWQSSQHWLQTVGTGVSGQSAADFTASVVARSAFESRAWAGGAKALFSGLRQGAHASSVLAGVSGLLRAGPSMGSRTREDAA